MSILSRIYNRINWKNYPSVQTPINESNLNKMDSALYTLDGRIVTLSSNIQNAVTSFNYDEQTGKITVSKFDGSTQTINTNISKIATNWSYNPVTQEMIIEMVDGTETRVLLSDLLSPMEIKDSNTIEHFTDRNGQVWFNIKANSITDSMIEPNYLAKLQEQADKGAGYVAESETNMNLSVAAKESSENFSKLSKSYAVGGTGTREGEDTDNAKYYSEQAKSIVNHDYDVLINKPSINGHELVGNLTTEDLEISAEPEGYSDLVTTVGTHTTEISTLSENVIALNDDLADINKKIYMPADDDTDFNELTETGTYKVWTLGNAPVISGANVSLSKCSYMVTVYKENDQNITQQAQAYYGDNNVYTRSMVRGVWSDWVQLGNSKLLSDAYDSEKTYTVGEYCIHDNKMWKCKVQCQGQTPAENSYWTACKIGDEIKQINDGLSGKFATAQYTYSDTTVPYPSGFSLDNCCIINKYVLYAQKLYYNAIKIDEYRANGVSVSRVFPDERAFANAPSFLVFMKYQ